MTQAAHVRNALVQIYPVAAVGVALTLLLFFIAGTSPRDCYGPDLPFAAHPGILVERRAAAKVIAMSNGKVLLQRELVSQEELLSGLHGLRHGHSSRQLILMADERLDYRVVRHVFRAASEAGFSEVTIRTEKLRVWPIR